MANNARQTNPAPAQRPTAPLEFLERYLSLQEREMQTRAEQLSLDAKHLENNRALAEASLQAQLKDREAGRAFAANREKWRILGGLAVVVILAGLCTFAMQMGKDAVALRIIEIAGSAVLGFIGGYGFKSLQAQNSSDQAPRQ